MITILLNNIRESLVILLNKRGLDSREVVITIIGILVFDIILISRMNTAKRKYLLNQQEEENSEDNKRYIEYYKKKQYMQTIRGIMRVILIMSIVLYHNPNIFAGLAIAIGAFVISFGSVFVGLGIYLYLLSFYSPGQHVKVGETTGEILAITPLYLKLLGRNESGEHTGELINIPNHKVWQDQIVAVDLGLTSIQKTIMDIGYDYDRFHLSFDEFVEQLQSFLDSILPKNTAATAEHYKSYKGYKYKLSFAINKQGDSVISMGFLCKRSKTSNYKYQIVSFLESLQKQTRLMEKQKQKKQTIKDEDLVSIVKNKKPTLSVPVGSNNVI